MVRVLFVACIVLVMLGDYTGLLAKLFSARRPQHDTGGYVTLGEGITGAQRTPGAPIIHLDADIDDDTPKRLGTSGTKSQILATIKDWCLPKLICELNATPHREKLTDSEKYLLNLIRDTSISSTAELTSHYHFAAHMGQLIAEVDGNGCHNFYPMCPIPGMQVLQMMKKIRIR